MKKQTKVLLAAAALTLGASFTSMAAPLNNGTWVLNEEGWQYADKNGEYVDEKWCVSYGTQYWINEDYVLGSSEWVVEEASSGKTYYNYAQSDGSKAINTWKYLYAPGDDDEEFEQDWYYFDSKGRMVANEAKFQIGDYYYYFDADGKMLTGWIDKNELKKAEEAAAPTVGTVVYCNEDGQLIRNSWLNMFPWTMTEDEAYEDDYKYFYADGNGKLYSTKKAIDNHTYFFNAETGAMMTGWIIKDGTVYTGANAKLAAGNEVYWTDDEIGYAKKNQWLKLATPQSDDSDSFWYWFDKNGKLFAPTATDSNVTEMNFADGESYDVEPVAGKTYEAKSKKFGDTYYFFRGNGEMIDGLVSIDNELNYLVDGARQTGSVSLEDDDLDNYTFYFAAKTDATAKTTKYAAVTGYFDGHVYKNGQMMTAVDNYAIVEVEINGKNYEFLVDVNGNVQYGTKEYTLDETHATYGDSFKAKDDNKAFNKSAKDVTKYAIINK